MIRKVTLLPLLSLVFICLASDTHSQTQIEMRETESYNNKTETKKVRLTVPQSAKSARLQVKADVQSGLMVFRLRDPQGEVRYMDVNTRDHLQADTGTFASVDGDWSLEVGLEKATGSYDIMWTAR